MVRAGRRLRGQEEASEGRPHAEERQNVRGHPDRPDLLGRVAARQIRAPVLGGAHVLEGAALRLPVEEVRGRDRTVAALEDHDEARGIRVGQRPHQDRVDDREDRRAGADAEREGEDGDGREPRRAAEEPQPVARVLPEAFERAPAPLCARRFLDQGLVAQLAPRGGLGFVRGFAAGHALANRHREVSGDLVVQFELAAPAEEGERAFHAVSGAFEASSTPDIAWRRRCQRLRSSVSRRRPAAVSR